MKTRAILFDIDDTLYDSTRVSTLARGRAIEAMIDAGLGVEHETVQEELQRVVAEFGSNYPGHFNVLLERLGVGPNNRLVAAGIVAYHNVKYAYLCPFEETVPTLLRLQHLGCRLGVVTNGKAVKQWEKLIRLGLQHLFATVVISEEIGIEKPDPRIFQQACHDLKVSPEDSAFVGNDLVKDIAGARGAGLLPILMRRGKHAKAEPSCDAEKPRFEIHRLAALLRLADVGKL